MVRLPPLTSVFPTGKGIAGLVQVNTGGGNPSAWQVSCNVEYWFGVVTGGGTDVKNGRPTNKVNLTDSS